MNCDPQVGWQRNVNRSDENISAVFTESFHERWLIGAREILTSAAEWQSFNGRVPDTI
ncbi:MAG: hypothetical protein OSA89_16430 [Mariniblastus sp.]|nr:hypothetical protein [Mariniblastus sp.]